MDSYREVAGMIELFEQNIRTNDRQSSKGNQLKWENKGIWYKADYTGYEGLAEYMISHLLKKSTLTENEFDEQLDISESLYNMNLKFHFTKKDVSKLLVNAGAYPEEIRNRVETVIFAQMRKYTYLFSPI